MSRNTTLYHKQFHFFCPKCGTRSPNNRKCFVCGGKKIKLTEEQLKKEAKKLKEGAAKGRKRGTSLSLKIG